MLSHSLINVNTISHYIIKLAVDSTSFLISIIKGFIYYHAIHYKIRKKMKGKDRKLSTHAYMDMYV